MKEFVLDISPLKAGLNNTFLAASGIISTFTSKKKKKIGPRKTFENKKMFGKAQKYTTVLKIKVDNNRHVILLTFVAFEH